MQRLRVRFSRGAEVKFISHLDIMRLWQRTLRRAGISIAYSEGFSPHPRISLAAPLAVGITSEAELMDVVLADWISPHSFTAAVGANLPGGFQVNQVYQLPLNVPSLQSLVRLAEYRVEVPGGKSRDEIEQGIASLISLKTLPWQHERDTGPRRYDLRPLIDRVWLMSIDGERCVLGMSLKCDNSGSGRPEQVSAALGFGYPLSIHRTRLVMKAS